MPRRVWLLAVVVVVTAMAGCASSTPPRLVGGGPGAHGAPEPATANYLIGAEDLLTIAVWREEGLTRQVHVRPDGRISFPLVGDIQAAGLTAVQLQAELTARLRAMVQVPVVTVIVDEVNSYRVFVLGEVERPGRLPAKSPVTILQALSLAGGLKPFANGDRMVLVRQLGARTVRVALNYRDLVLGRNGAVNLVLESGDTLVVP